MGEQKTDLPNALVDKSIDHVTRETEEAAHAAGRKAEVLAECRRTSSPSPDFIRKVASGYYR